MTKGTVNGKRAFENLVSRVELQVTAEDLEAFDDSSFLEEQPDELRRPADTQRLLRRLEKLEAVGNLSVTSTKADGVPAGLFAEMQIEPFATGSRYDFEVDRKQFSALMPLVLQAFFDVRAGWSADYLILNPEMDLAFIQRCWQLGAAATPEELNWTLMNARKNGKLKGVASDSAYSVPKRELDEFSFAAEMALRELQDRAWYEEQRDNLSLDKLLCSPRLSIEFDRLAKQIAPGFSSLQYRWAAMALRKARRLVQSALPMPLFDDLGLLRDVKPSCLTNDGGIYVVSFDDRSAFVGVASSLRLQVDSFIGRLGEAAFPVWVPDRPVGHARMRILAMAAAKWDDRERLRSSIFRRHGSRLNFKDSKLFGGALGVA